MRNIIQRLTNSSLALALVLILGFNIANAQVRMDLPSFEGNVGDTITAAIQVDDITEYDIESIDL